MDLYEVMRTTFSGREFRDEPVSDAVLARVFDHARFAPSGGNRQGWKVIVVRDSVMRNQLAELSLPMARRYVAELRAGENPINTIVPSRVSDAEVAALESPEMMVSHIRKAPVVLVPCVDLKRVAATDRDLPRIGLVAGASIYTLVWNILLAARNEGLSGTITTSAVAAEPQVQQLLGIPREWAVAALVPIGVPVRQLTRLRRMPLEEIAVRDHFDGAQFTASEKNS